MPTSLKSHADYTVGWICALPKEQTAARALLDEIHPDLPTNDENSYIFGSMSGHNVVITCLPKGKVGTSEAAVAATNMLHTFPSIKVGLMVGIGGGIPPVRLGDVVVSTPTGVHPGVVQWDFGKEEGDGTFQRVGAMSNPPRALLKALTKVETIHDFEGTKMPEYLSNMQQKWPKLTPKFTRMEHLHDPFRSPRHSVEGSGNKDHGWFSWLNSIFWLLLFSLFSRWGEKIASETPQLQDSKQSRKPRDVKVHYGLIASGNKVIKNAKIRDGLNKNLGGNVLCVEMEAAGLVNFPCVVVRGICDYADSQKNDEWQEYAATVAAAFAKELLEYVQANDVEKELPMKTLISEVRFVSEKVSMIKSQLDKKEDLKILDWVTNIDFDKQQTDYFNKREPGTGKWLLDSTKYQDWIESKQILFCPGIPGAGKTILSALVVDDLMDRFAENSDIGIAYIFCNFRRKDEQKIEDLTASLLKQLTRFRPVLPEAVRSLHNHATRRSGGKRPSINEIIHCLKSVSAEYKKVFIVIDALDEAQISNGCQNALLSLIFQLHAENNMNFLCTSRLIHGITGRFGNYPSLEILAEESDVRKYLEGQMSQMTKSWFIDQRNEIITEITKVANGMFLLAQLHFQAIKTKTSLKKMKDALKALPSGEKAYDTAYKDAMHRLNGQDTDSAMLANQVLSWITRARRPLATSELRYALAVEVRKPGEATDAPMPCESEMNEENLPDVEDMISVCGGLVTIDEESNIIRLIHYTTQEYFERSWKIWFSDAEVNITKTCVTYLNYEIFHSEPQAYFPLDSIDPQLTLFYKYAAEYWADHARASHAGADPLALAFLTNDTAVLVCYKVLTDGIHTLSIIKHHSRCIGICLAAYGGVIEAVSTMIRSGVDVDHALSSAVLGGHENTVQLLLKHGADIGQIMTNGDTLIAHAARYASEAMVKFLLENGADSRCTDDEADTALHVAGTSAIANLLLDNGADIESLGMYQRTPLLNAIRNGKTRVAETLIERGANLEARDIDHITPLISAVSIPNYRAAEMLIQKGAYLDARDKDEWTPIAIAIGNLSTRLAQRIYASDLISYCGYRQTSRKSILAFRLERGMFLNAARSKIRRNYNDKFVASLINRGANPKSKCFGNFTPLGWAMSLYEADVEDYLILQEDSGTTYSFSVDPALQLESLGLYDASPEDIQEFSTESGRAGDLASLSRILNLYEALVKLLIDKGADIEAADPDSRTPLSRLSNLHGRIKSISEQNSEGDFFQVHMTLIASSCSRIFEMIRHKLANQSSVQNPTTDDLSSASFTSV